jgi:hypothetical protein
VSEQRQTKFYSDLMTLVQLNPKDAGGSLSFTGPTDPVYDSSYFLVEGTSAILGAIGSAVAQIWKARSGEEQDIVVDRLHAVQALHRVNFLKQSGYPIVLTAPFNPTGLTHRCGDGRFIETTTALRHLELAMLDLLDCANTDAACREAYMRWNTFELEEAIAHHNLAGVVLRTRQEWRKHLQGRALMESPVITKRPGVAERQDSTFCCVSQCRRAFQSRWASALEDALCASQKMAFRSCVRVHNVG